MNEKIICDYRLFLFKFNFYASSLMYALNLTYVIQACDLSFITRTKLLKTIVDSNTTLKSINLKDVYLSDEAWQTLLPQLDAASSNGEDTISLSLLQRKQKLQSEITNIENVSKKVSEKNVQLKSKNNGKH